MSEETPVAEEQLFDSDDSEVAEDDATDSEAGSEETAEEEQEQGLDLDDDSSQENKTPTNKAEESRLNQLRAFQKKVKAGDITSVDELPKAQKWMADYLQFPNSDPKLDPDELKSELLKELKNERKNELESESFSKLKSELEDKADSNQKGIIQDKYKALRAKGLSKLDALELSAELASVDLSGLQARKKAMRIPSPGSLKGRKKDLSSMEFGDIAKKLTPEQQVKYLESLQ